MCVRVTVGRPHLMQDTPEYTEQIPATIGRYKVESVLGYGAMGAVYKAFDPLIKRTLAIKTLRLDVVRNSPQYKSFIERFNHEARISGTLSHPNIVTLFDIGEEGGLPFLAMEYVAGETIAAIIDRGERFAPERIVGLVSQVAAAIDYAHSRAVVHRDIKPSNLILSEGDRVKVTDFGIAKLADTDMTQSGVLLGTPSYMSPEQAMGEPLDGRSDIFSLGVCAFEMLSGEQPFPGTNVTSILYKLVHVDPIEPPDLEMSGLVPDKWREVFGKVLAKKPVDRYQTAAEFVQDLELCLGAWFGSTMAPDGLDRTLVTTEAMPVLPSALKPPSREADAAGETADLALPGTNAPASTPAPQDAGAPEEDEQDHTILLRHDEPTAPLPASKDDLAETTVLPPGAGLRSSTGQIPPRVPPDTRASTPPPLPPSATPVPGGTVTRTRTPPPVAPRQTAVGGMRPPTAPASSRGPATWLVVAVGAFGIVAVAAMTVLIVNLLHRPAPVAPTPAVVATPEPTPVPLPATTEGMLTVSSEPAGASVTVNGEGRGETPVELRLPLGLYDVQLALKGYLSQQHSVELTESNAQVQMTLTLQRSSEAKAPIRVASTPSGALVLIDGARVGHTPLESPPLAPGRHRVEISLEGYQSAQREVTTRAGKPKRLVVELERTAPAATPPPPAPVATVDHARIYESTEVDQPPKKVKGLSPDPVGLPKLKSGEKISITVSFVVTEDGEVADINIEKSEAGPKMNESVTRTLRRWKFQPGVLHGEKVKVRQTRIFTYKQG
jgi:TonB family protein